LHCKLFVYVVSGSVLMSICIISRRKGYMGRLVRCFCVRSSTKRASTYTKQVPVL
jgi:hypothetical protein